jgi:N-acetylglucosamine-6-phosphate deacetylase
VRLGVEAAVVGGELVPGDVEVEGGLVAGVGLGGPGRGIALPGLVDLQVNGYAGVDLLSEPERAGEVAAALARDGVTSWQPTLVTAPLEQTCEAARIVASAPGSVGVHLEGPFLSPSKAGVHPVELLREPDLDVLRPLLDMGSVATVTLAPELPGALGLVEELVASGVVVSLGHTDATADVAKAAFERGASTVTHLYNAMRGFGHRDPGVVGAALARPDVAVQLIADGVHVAGEAVLVAWRAARGRLAIVSDAIAAAGLGDGTYRLSGVEVHVAGGVARDAGGALAGSTSSLLAGLRNLVRLGVPLVDAAGAASLVPARILGREDLGRLRPDGPADLVVLDDRLDVVRVLSRGEAAS